MIVIPSATIVVDGSVGDWGGISPLATDPQGDDSPFLSGDDIKALWAATDTANLYLRMDLWEDANTGFGNGTERQGRYLLNVVNSGPWPDMSVGIGYGAEWFVGYNGSSSDVPAALEGPSFVAVHGGVIELKLPLDMIGNPSMYYGVHGVVQDCCRATGNYATLDEAGVGEKSYIPDFRDALRTIANR